MTRLSDEQLVVSEAEWTATVIELAHLAHWKCAHFRASLSGSGRWHTAVQGDGVGFPDLCMARDGEVIFAELKAKGGRLRPEQRSWLMELTGGLDKPQQVGVYVWRPKDVAEVKRVLGIKEVGA